MCYFIVTTTPPPPLPHTHKLLIIEFDGLYTLAKFIICSLRQKQKLEMFEILKDKWFGTYQFYVKLTKTKVKQCK